MKMKKITFEFITLLVFLMLSTQANAANKFFVVERESSALAVINHHLLSNKIKGMHNLNHAVVKFKDKDGIITGIFPEIVKNRNLKNAWLYS